MKLVEVVPVETKNNSRCQFSALLTQKLPKKNFFFWNGLEDWDPGYRQQMKDLGKGVWHGTADYNNMIQSDDNKEQWPPKPDAKQGDKDTYLNPSLLPSTI